MYIYLHICTYLCDLRHVYRWCIRATFREMIALLTEIVEFIELFIPNNLSEVET